MKRVSIGLRALVSTPSVKNPVWMCILGKWNIDEMHIRMWSVSEDEMKKK